TRFSRDWSSDVCSSDLARQDEAPLAIRLQVGRTDMRMEIAVQSVRGGGLALLAPHDQLARDGAQFAGLREQAGGCLVRLAVGLGRDAMPLEPAQHVFVR